MIRQHQHVNESRSLSPLFRVDPTVLAMQDRVREDAALGKKQQENAFVVSLLVVGPPT